MNGVPIEPYQKFAEAKLGFRYKNIDLLITALTHRSYLNEHRKSATEHNERLEFLGDAVLELAVTEYLFKNYQEPEGILTTWRSALVRTESIGEAGEELGYEPLIRMSRGERHGSERARRQILANSFEALVGSIYLERGFEDAVRFINKSIISKLDGILKSGSWRDAKSYLQEVAQRVDNRTPQYRVLKEVGPDHDKVFTLGVYVKDRLMGVGEGPNKQVAQQLAAEKALEKYSKASQIDKEAKTE